MPVPFNNIPQDVRVPLFYAEMDNSQANGAGTGVRRALLIGQKLTAGSAAVNQAYIVPTVANARALFGQGSMLARMHEKYRAADTFGEVWCIAATEPAAGASAQGTITLTGNASANGTLNLYIAGQRVQAAALVGDTPTIMATSLVAAIAAKADLPVTASNAAGVITLTSKWKGQTGNDITLFDNFAGSAGGEALPAGVTVAYSAPTLAGGTSNPTLTQVIAAMGDEEYDFIGHPFTDSTSLDALDAEMNDTAGRWAWNRMIYGHVYSAQRGALGALVAAGQLRNGPHHTIAGIDADCPVPSWEYAASYAARNAVFINADPARPTQTGELSGLALPRQGKRFLLTERQSLLSYGIATSYVAGGALRIERAITTYQKNAYGQPDTSYLDSETLHTSAYVLRRLKGIVTSKYGRHKLADDGTRFGPGAAIVTPSVIRGELTSEYKKMEYEGIVENAKAFAANLIVERSTTDPNRVNVLYPPDYINQLRIFALLNQFRLQYS